ncbi:MAG TPA: amino acid synthesis family protein [Acidimicrobiales bacterium]|nr:amino acid synthesis family protein [Acidimicrobiales bacterium]
MPTDTETTTAAESCRELPSGVTVRKWVYQVEEILVDGGRPNERPLRKVVVAAVISNPYAGKWSESLDALVDAGEVLAEEFTVRAQKLLGSPVEAYGKGGIAGEHGELEHVAAVLHPKFGAPTRRLAGGVSILPSVKKLGGVGSTLDIPVHHKRAMLVRSHFDAVEFRVGDAPRADELLVALAVTNGPRPHARVGGLREEDAQGIDGLH